MKNRTTLRGIIVFLLLLMLVGCGHHSQEDFREEGEAATRSLIQVLQSIQTRDQLLESSGKLQSFFERLVNLMIAAEEFCVAHPEIEREELTPHNHELSDQLRVELNRLYRLEGGRQMIEKCQERALQRLDAFEKQKNKLNAARTQK